MKVTFENTEVERELVAVVDNRGEGLFVAGQGDTVQYIATNLAPYPMRTTLQDVLNLSSGRKPVYKGDTVKITF